MAVTASARIHTPSGDRLVATVAEVGEPVLAFTWRDDRITFGKVSARPAGKRPVVDVVLDNGDKLTVCGEQLAITRSEQVAANLDQAGLSLLPLYFGVTTCGYPTYCQQGKDFAKAPAPCDQRRWRLISRLVYEWKIGRQIPTGVYVRHKDKNRLNCSPENLVAYEGCKRGRLRREIRFLFEMQDAIARLEAELGWNHQVVSVSPARQEETFDLIGHECSNVAVNEIFLVTSRTGAE